MSRTPAMTEPMIETVTGPAPRHATDAAAGAAVDAVMGAPTGELTGALTGALKAGEAARKRVPHETLRAESLGRLGPRSCYGAEEQPGRRPARQPHARWEAAVVADRLAVSLCFARHRITLPLARAARRFIRTKSWFTFGYARLEDHARERFHRSGRWARDLCSLAESSARFPELAPALTGEDGGHPIGRVVALLIGRVASRATCAEWIALARQLTVREFRDLVSRARAAGSSTPVGSGSSAEEAASSDELVPAEWTCDDASTDEVRYTLRFAAPRPVIAAFDEARDLYGAVSGGAESLASFVEALLAEAWAGPEVPDGADPWPVRRPDEASRERALAEESDRWAILRRTSDTGRVLAEARATLDDVERSCRAAEMETGDTDQLIRALARLEDEIELRLGNLLAEMGRHGAWRNLQFGGVGHYGEERLGLSRTTAEDRARLARALRDRPLLRQAYREGQIGSEAAALLLRMMKGKLTDDGAEAAWVDHARVTSIKRLRDESRYVVRESVLTPGGETGRPPDDRAWHGSLHRRPGRAIDRLGAFAKAATEPGVETGVLYLRLPVDLASELMLAVEGRRRHIERTIRPRVEDAEISGGGPASSRTAARAFSSRLPFLPSWIGLFALLEDFVVTWDDPRRSPRRPRDEVYMRDGWRCSAPGCTSRQNLEDHHIVYRSRGGSDALSNRTTLCRFHHQRGEHGGLMECRGAAPLEMVWRLGYDGIGGLHFNERSLASEARTPVDAKELRGDTEAEGTNHGLQDHHTAAGC